MRAYRLTAQAQAAVTDVPEPRPAAEEVVLGVLGAGVCRTDLGLLQSGLPNAPVTLGHEIVGQVLDVGSSVDPAKVGRKVAVYELIGCGHCRACERGEDNLCREGTPAVPGITRDGGMAERVAVPARNLVDIGDLDPVQAAPLTDAGVTALHAVERGRAWLKEGASAVVVGVGGLGHMAIQFALAIGDAQVFAVDVAQGPLDLALELGAAGGVLAGEGAEDALLSAASVRKVDVVFDFVGSKQTLDLAARAVGRGGAIVVTGGGGGRLCITAEMGAGRSPDREVTMIHTFGGTRGDLAKSLELAAEGRVRTHVQPFDLEDAGRALAELEAGRVLGRAVVVPGL